MINASLDTPYRSDYVCHVCTTPEEGAPLCVYHGRTPDHEWDLYQCLVDDHYTVVTRSSTITTTANASVVTSSGEGPLDADQRERVLAFNLLRGRAQVFRTPQFEAVGPGCCAWDCTEFIGAFPVRHNPNVDFYYCTTCDEIHGKWSPSEADCLSVREIERWSTLTALSRPPFRAALDLWRARQTLRGRGFANDPARKSGDAPAFDHHETGTYLGAYIAVGKRFDLYLSLDGNLEARYGSATNNRVTIPAREFLGWALDARRTFTPFMRAAERLQEMGLRIDVKKGAPEPVKAPLTERVEPVWALHFYGFRMPKAEVSEVRINRFLLREMFEAHIDSRLEYVSRLGVTDVASLVSLSIEGRLDFLVNLIGLTFLEASPSHYDFAYPSTVRRLRQGEVFVGISLPDPGRTPILDRFLNALSGRTHLGWYVLPSATLE